MIVKITNFDENAEMPYIDYEVRGLLQIQMDFLNENLEEETSIDEDIFNILGIFLKGSIKVKIIFLRQSLKDGMGKAPLVPRGLPAHNRDRPFAYGKGRIRYHKLRIKLHPVAKAGALRAGPEGIVKGEAPGLNLINADPAVGAGKILAEIQNAEIVGLRLLHLCQRQIIAKL